MSDVPQPARKPYSPPVLKVYGDLTRLTNAVGHKGKNGDGGAMSAQKTS